MIVQDVFRDLSIGELRNLSLSNEGSGDIREQDRDSIITYINDALIRLYTRFPLREKSVLIEQQLWVTNYHLSSKYADSNPDAYDPKYPRYIKDMGDPFIDDVVKILSVSNGSRFNYILNDRENITSLFTPYPDILQVPSPRQGQAMVATYQATHPKLELGTTNSSIEIPTVLYPALKAMVASTVYKNMNTAETAAKSSEHFSIYEMICGEVENQDAVNASTATTNTKFEKNGWK